MTLEYLSIKNPVLYSIIKGVATNNPEQTTVRTTAYWSITLINDQVKDNDLRKKNSKYRRGNF